MASFSQTHYPLQGYKEELGLSIHDRPYIVSSNKANLPAGWKYKSFKLGPFTIPWYASPEIQLLLVSLVCFLCPGRSRKDMYGLLQLTFV